MIRKTLLWPVLVLLLAAGMQTRVMAQQTAGDYASVRAPDVAQATAFLVDAMGCEPLGRAGASAERALLQCSHGTVVEIVRGKPAGGMAPLRLQADNLDAALAGLHARQIPVVDGPAVQGDVVRVDLVSPWGQPVQLVGHGSAADAGKRQNPRLAAD